MPAGQPFDAPRGRQLALGCVGIFMLPFIAAGIGLMAA